MTLERRSRRIAARPRRSSRIAAAAKAKEIANRIALEKAVRAAKNPRPKRTPKKTAPTKSKQSSAKKVSAKKKKQGIKPKFAPRQPKKIAKRKTKSVTKKASTKKTAKKASLPESPRRGVVDTEIKFDGTIRELDGEPCDVMLALVDPSQNMDKFYVLQLLERSKPINKKSKFTVFMRWGRTGSQGQTMATDYATFGQASTAFNTKFREKTGLMWKKRGSDTVDGKYRFIEQDYTEKRGGYRTGKWEYYVNDGVDGKKPGWYPYEDSASVQVERLFAEHSKNPRLATRVVASGYFSYEVDLGSMRQTNVTHPGRKSRKIRRSLKQ